MLHFADFVIPLDSRSITFTVDKRVTDLVTVVNDLCTEVLLWENVSFL